MTIAQAAVDGIRAHAATERPRECCGMLIGMGDAILRMFPARNLAPEPTRYLIDPADHLRALREARIARLEVVGFYHSHPHSPADPSPTDLAEATYPDSVYLIVGVREGREDLRLFRLCSTASEGVPLEVQNGPLPPG